MLATCYEGGRPLLSMLLHLCLRRESGREGPSCMCAPELRRHLRRITERVFPHLAVLSMAEVPTTMDLKAFGVVTL